MKLNKYLTETQQYLNTTQRRKIGLKNTNAACCGTCEYYNRGFCTSVEMYEAAGVPHDKMLLWFTPFSICDFYEQMDDIK